MAIRRVCLPTIALDHFTAQFQLVFYPPRLFSTTTVLIYSNPPENSITMRSVLIVSFALSFLHAAVATDANPRVLHARDLFLDKRDLCTENGQVDCYDSCSPPDAVCCSDGSGTYCPNGEYCVPDGCCPNGESCSGGGGTLTNDILTGTGTTAPLTTNQAQTTHAQTTATGNGNTQGGGLSQNTATQNANTQTTAAATKTVTAPTGNAQNTGAGSTTTVVASSGSSRNAMANLAVLVLVAGQSMLGW